MQDLQNLDSNNSFPEKNYYNYNIFKSSHNPIWEDICNKILKIISLQEFNIWIKPLKIAQPSNDKLIIYTPNSVFYQGLCSIYLNKIEQTKNILGYDFLNISVEIENKALHKQTDNQSNKIDKNKNSEFEINLRTNPLIINKEGKNKCYGLNPSYTFKTFVKGDSNKFSYAAAWTVSEAPGKTYNPLFIYGSTGLGKTHLLHAIGNKIQNLYPSTNIVYVSSEIFMNEFINCIRFNKMMEFRKKYRQCDVLLIDDIQFIPGREKTQEEFFHTFNILYENQKQIVISSDLYPQDLPDIEERLRNRFQWGLIADIQPPSLEHRIAILYKKAELLRIKLPEDVAIYIANNVKRNIRELEGALHRLAAFSVLKATNISKELAIEALQHMFSNTQKILTIEQIQKIVAEHFKIKISDLKSKKRQKFLTIPRQIAMYLARVKTNASFPEIGEKFGGKDHTTIMHGFKKIEENKQKDLDLKSLIETLERKIDNLYF